MKLTAFALTTFLGCAVALPQLGQLGNPGRGPPASSDLPTPVFSSGNPQRPTGVFDKRQLGQPGNPGRGPPSPGEVPGRGPPAPCEMPGRGPPVDGKDDACTPLSATPSSSVAVSSSGFSSVPTVSITPTPSSTPVSSASLF